MDILDKEIIPILCGKEQEGTEFCETSLIFYHVQYKTRLLFVSLTICLLLIDYS